jgi:ABC-type multidrug transport system ATPase subunit
LWTPVGDLSGGERRRLQLLRLLAGEPNVLLLDEPTNDLDTDTLAGLEDLLDSWPGTLLVASHDRYLIERVTDTVFGMFGDGRLVHLPGGVEEYLARRLGAGDAVPVPRTAVPADGRAARADGRAGPVGGANGGGPAGGDEGLSAGDARAARKELARLERQVGKLEQREAQLHARLAEHATDYAKVTELDEQLRVVRAERERAEESWLALAERLPDG